MNTPNNISTTYQKPLAFTRTPSRRGMTLFEVMFSVMIIFLGMGLIIGAVRIATSTIRNTAHQAAVLALKQGVEQFQQEFDFPPPLVRDWGTPPPPLSGDPIGQDGPQGEWVPRIYRVGTAAHLDFLRRQDQRRRFQDPDYRFSLYTLPYYLIGVLDQDRGDPRNPDLAIDGVPGPGFRTPQRDGSFDATGRTHQPFFAVGSGSTTLYTTSASQGRIELRDSNGIAFRYYRWEPGTSQATGSRPLRNVRNDTNIPLMVARFLPGDEAWPDFPGEQAEQPGPSVIAARYAIVAAGADGLFGDEFLLAPQHPQYVPLREMMSRLRVREQGNDELNRAAVMRKAMEDNIVEVGR